ncbi:MAG: hypothetical protein Q8R28_05155 [Dehalococcoidia bacterium]|nr:hypothetical protein [Dehalococcoidia bacterium]
MFRSSAAALVLFSLILVGLSATAGGCDSQADGAKSTVNAFYDAVVRGDRMAEIALWTPDRQDQGASDADAWAKRDKEALKLEEVHIDSGPADDQRLAHITLSIDDKARPGKRRYESRVLLLQQMTVGWRIRDER